MGGVAQSRFDSVTIKENHIPTVSFQAGETDITSCFDKQPPLDGDF